MLSSVNQHCRFRFSSFGQNTPLKLETCFKLKWQTINVFHFEYSNKRCLLHVDVYSKPAWSYFRHRVGCTHLDPPVGLYM